MLASNASAGHGRVLDLGHVDEAFDDIDDRRAGDVAGDDHEAGRSAVGRVHPGHRRLGVPEPQDRARRACSARGQDVGICFFEWGVPDDADIHDPASWWLGMPALGHTQSIEAISRAKQTMTEGEFRRAFGNQRARSNERAIPEMTWRVACRSDVAPTGRLSFAVDVAPDRDWASIAAAAGAWSSSSIIDPALGGSSNGSRRLVADHGGAVVLEATSPAGALVPGLRSKGVQVRELSAAEVTRACGTFYDDVADGRVQIRIGPFHEYLEAAVAAVAKQPVGDTWRWGRKRLDPITPLMVVTLARASPAKSKRCTPVAPGADCRCGSAEAARCATCGSGGCSLDETVEPRTAWQRSGLVAGMEVPT